MTTLLQIYDEKIGNGTLKPDADQRRAVEALNALARGVEKAPARRGFLKKRAEPQPKGLYLHGGVGRGKSMVMDLFFETVPGIPKCRVHFHAFMLEVHDFLHKRRSEGAERRIDGDLIACADHIAENARLLCFDEFHVKDVADAMILGRLFTALFRAGVVCVMTSNIAPDDLYKDGLQRDRFLPFIALLKEKMDLVHFAGGTDYRLGRLAGKKVYFWPHDKDAARELDHLFRMMADEQAGAPLDIAVKGRIIHVPRAHREVAAFSFAELCEEKRSALDYLELLKTFRVFTLSDVPQMDDEKRDAALRFVTLVDTAYDQRARMIISAAVPPEKLYRGEMHAEAFRRTVSRLMEMQSKEYGEGA